MRLQSAPFILGAALLALTSPAWAQSTAITPMSTGVQPPQSPPVMPIGVSPQTT